MDWRHIIGTIIVIGGCILLAKVVPQIFGF